MAIWQFKLCFIPKKSLINKYGAIPQQLFIDRDGWENYFKNSSLENKIDFEDASSIAWWLDLNIFIETVFTLIDNFGYPMDQRVISGLTNFGDVDKNNISVCFDEKTNQIEELSCRLDLRQIETEFLINMLSLAKQFDCLFMDKQGRLFQPTLAELDNMINLSNAKRFVLDPQQFLEDMSNGVIKPE